MGKYIFNRLLNGILVLAGVVCVVFALFMLMPGDPARLSLGQKGDSATIAAMRRDMGLDLPRSRQFINYVNDLSPVGSYGRQDSAAAARPHIPLWHTAESIVQLKLPYLRRSYLSQRPVADTLRQAAANTAVLALAAFLLAAGLGIWLGTQAALHKGKPIEGVIMFIANLGISVPSFFAAILIAWLFGYVLHSVTGLNMFGSLYEIDPFRGPEPALQNLILPALALGIRPLAVITQLTRGSMLEVLRMDFMRTGRAKGLPRRRLIWVHGVRNALNPVVTAVSGWLAGLLSGAFFIEFIFGWAGLGKVTVDALLANDLPVVMGAVLYIAAIFVVINILVDIAYAALDPRVRLA